MNLTLSPSDRIHQQNIPFLVFCMPAEDTEAQTKLFEPAVLAGNGSALNTMKIKQKYTGPKITYT